jgi:hypothetical protein
VSKRPMIHLYCTCGASAKITFLHGTTPTQIQRVARRFYDVGHQGTGHAPCDKATADRVRRREDKDVGVYWFGEE